MQHPVPQRESALTVKAILSSAARWQAASKVSRLSVCFTTPEAPHCGVVGGLRCLRDCACLFLWRCGKDCGEALLNYFV